MTAVDTHTDQKAGFCGRCRSGQHALCGSPPGRCTCTGHQHPNRPTARPQEAPVPAAARPVAAVPTVPDRPRASSATAKKEPVWELVKEDPAAPPPKPRKLTPAERALPFLETIVEAEDRSWHRIAVFSTPHAAGRVKAVLAKDYAANGEWGVEVGQGPGQPPRRVRALAGRA